MSGLILPTPGLLMGGKKKIELVSWELKNQSDGWGRSGDNPAPYTMSTVAGSGEVIALGSSGRVGTLEGSARSTDPEIDGEDGLSWTYARTSQGKRDDVVGGGMCDANGALTNPVFEDRSVDSASRADGWGFGCLVLSNASRWSRVGAAGLARDGATYSLTVNVVAGGYVMAYASLRGATGLGWTGVTSIAQQNATLHHGIAGKEITADGTLTVTLGSQTNQGYMGVLSYAPA